MDYPLSVLDLASIGSGSTSTQALRNTTVRALRPFDSAQFPEQFPEPHAILAVSVVCAKTDEQADWLARSMDLAWVRLVRGEFGRLPSPEEATAYPYTPQEQAVVRARRAIQFIVSPATVRAGIDALVQETGANEVMVTSMVHSHAERMRSYELLAERFGLRPSPWHFSDSGLGKNGQRRVCHSG